MPVQAKTTEAGLTCHLAPQSQSAILGYQHTDGSVESYTLVLEEPGPKAYLRIYSNQAGEPADINACAVPFSFDRCCAALEAAGAVEHLTVLQRQSLKMLDSFGMTLEPIIASSRFTHFNYPDTFIFIVASSWRIRTETSRHINRELLARYLGLEKIGKNQMRLLRCLDGEGVNASEYRDAIRLVTNPKRLLNQYLSRSEKIDARTILLMKRIAEMSREVVSSRWFRFPKIRIWRLLAERFNLEMIGEYYEVYAAAFVIQWQTKRIQNRIHDTEYPSGLMYNFIRTVDGSESHRESKYRMNVAQLICDVSQRLPGVKKAMIQEIFGLFLENLVIRDVKDVDCLYSSGLYVRNTYFSPIQTAGELRQMSVLLANCAHQLCEMATATQRMEFWRYKNPRTGENAMLQINAHAHWSKRQVKFLGYDNLKVSAEAIAHYHAWMGEVVLQAEGGDVVLLVNRLMSGAGARIVDMGAVECMAILHKGLEHRNGGDILELTSALQEWMPDQIIMLVKEVKNQCIDPNSIRLDLVFHSTK